MLFLKAKKTPETALDIVTAQGKVLEVVTGYKYLGIWLDDCLSFKLQVNNLIKKLFSETSPVSHLRPGKG